MEIGIKVISEDIKDHTIKNTNVCYFTMVAVDENGVPMPVPKLELITEDDKRRLAESINDYEPYAAAVKCIDDRLNNQL